MSATFLHPEAAARQNPQSIKTHSNSPQHECVAVLEEPQNNIDYMAV